MKEVEWHEENILNRHKSPEYEVEEEIEEERESELEEERERNIRATKAWLFASILITLFISLLASIRTESSILLAILGFAPTIIATIIFIGLLEGDYKDVLFWLTPLAMLMLFLGMEPFMKEILGGQLDVPALAAINLLLSYVILIVMSLFEYRREKLATLADLEEFKPEALEQYIHTIEDKCKAINFVIGRVYRASNGGTKELREKIKIPSEWYNEFNAIPADAAQNEEQELAINLIKRIKEQLSILLRPEKDVFTKEELKELRNITRDLKGKDRIIDVLSVNDSDPVENYFLGAMEFCKKIIRELENL